ncbi:tape measure domain-containing protein [Enterococcus termitis]|nr:tape measure domain-containing protein [Enterococcus termitis]
MDALGFSADESSRNVNKLSDGIDGLPTKLDDVVATAQRMTSVTGNLDKSTDATLALNNAMLASGASTDDASRGMEQYIQMLSTGKVDMQSWRTLQETMPIGLQKTAEAMGFLGRTAQVDLYAALKEGKVTFDQFQDQLIELGTGTGELAKLAKVNSEGIATSFGNLKNAAAKGIANIIEALNDLSKATTGKNIAQNLDSMKVLVNATFKSITTVIKSSTPIVAAFVTVLSSLGNAIKPLIPTITSFVATFVALKIVKEVGTYFSNTEAFIRLYIVATELAALATSSLAREQLLQSVATKANNVLIAAKTALLVVQNTIMGVLTGTTSLAAAATTALSAAIQFLLGPIGWAVAIIGSLVAVTVNLWKWFNKESEEVKALRGEQEELIKTTDEMAKKNEDAAISRKGEIDKLAETKANYTALIEEMDMLSNKEKLSNSEKKRMTEILEVLNGKLGDLNLVYDEQNNILAEQPEKIQQQIDAFHALDEASSAQERINEMLKQRNDNEAKLMEINIARERWNETLKQSSGSIKDAKENISQMNEEEQKLLDAQSSLQAEIIKTADDAESSLQRAAAATEGSVLQQTVSYDALQGKNKEVMDALRAEYQSLEEKVGNVFDAIDQKQAISTDQMIANLQKNQEAVSQWSENIAILAERGIDQGLLEQLRKMGPEGAAQAAELVNSSDIKLQELNEVYRQSGETSLNAMREGLQLGKHGVNEEIASIIPTQKETLSSQVAEANFSEVGKNAVDNVSSGVENARNALNESMKGIITQSEAAVRTELQNSNFKDIGLSIPQGLEKGVTDGKEQPIKSVTEMTDDLIKGAKTKLDTHSPSKVFHEIGENVTQGLSNGIEGQSAAAIQAVHTLVEQIIQSTNGLSDHMVSIGQYAMMGLANGIYSGSGAALDAARSVANSITNTMKSALDINSPSRVMRDEVGRFLPQGVAEGIEKDTGVALSAIDKLSNLLSGRITPEAALNIPRFSESKHTEIIKSRDTSSGYQAPTISINIEHADLSSDRGIEETSKQLALLTEREMRGSLT